jgi:excisionase family DNA binding protein
MPMEQRLMTIPEFMRVYRVCRSTVYALIDDGKIERVKRGRSARITCDSADRWFKGLSDDDPVA